MMHADALPLPDDFFRRRAAALSPLPSSAAFPDVGTFLLQWRRRARRSAVSREGEGHYCSLAPCHDDERL